MFTRLAMALSLKFFPFALGFTSLLSRISSFYPWSLSSQTSSCSPSLDSSESDRAVSSLAVPPNHAVFLQIFRIDIPGMYHMDLSRDDSTRDRSMRYISGISACIESDVTQCIVARSAYRFCYRHCEVSHRWTYLDSWLRRNDGNRYEIRPDVTQSVCKGSDAGDVLPNARSLS